METPSKRRSNNDSETITLKFLINQPRILSESEYKNKLIYEPYSEYLTNYFQKRIPTIFSDLKNKTWFYDRYIKKESVVQKNFIKSPFFFVIGNIDYNISYNEIRETFMENPDIIDIFVDQNDYVYKYSRDLYINLKSDADVDYLLSNLNFFSKAYYYVFEKKPIEENYQIPNGIVKGIFRDLCEKNGLDGDDILSTYVNKNKYKFVDETEILVNVLRDKFRYCTHCAKMYDNEIIMYKKCSGHRFPINVMRNMEIAAIKKNFDNIMWNDMTNMMYNKISESIFKCTICDKRFESEEFIIKHLNGKHASEMVNLNDDVDNFKCFLKNIDSFIFSIICGIDHTGIPPWFGDVHKSQTLPFYDLPLIYSGEICFKPSIIN